MRVTNRETGEELTNFEIHLNKRDLEKLLPWLQGRLDDMTAHGLGETVIVGNNQDPFTNRIVKPS